MIDSKDTLSIIHKLVQPNIKILSIVFLVIILLFKNVDIISYMVGTSIGVIPWLMIEIFVGSKVSNVNKLYNYI